MSTFLAIISAFGNNLTHDAISRRCRCHLAMRTKMVPCGNRNPIIDMTSLIRTEFRSQGAASEWKAQKLLGPHDYDLYLRLNPRRLRHLNRSAAEILGSREMVTLKESIENNPVVWLLGTLLTGFIAGVATYHGVLEIAHLDVVPKGDSRPTMPINTNPEVTPKEIETIKGQWEQRFAQGGAWHVGYVFSVDIDDDDKFQMRASDSSVRLYDVTWDGKVWRFLSESNGSIGRFEMFRQSGDRYLGSVFADGRPVANHELIRLVND